jgi:hypothetical protein
LRDLRAVQPAPLLPVFEPHPIVVIAGFATHPIAFTGHYAPNLAVSTDDIAALRIDSWIAVGHDPHYHFLWFAAEGAVVS